MLRCQYICSFNNALVKITQKRKNNSDVIRNWNKCYVFKISVKMAVLQPAMRTLTHLPNRPAINIEFEDLNYSVPIGRKDSKVILKNVNGNFKAGQLTAILGPSGAGKSTLLNILAGFKSEAAGGLVTLNGEPRDISRFRHISRYIMHDNIMQPYLTVQESMLTAAELKLNLELSKDKKLVAVNEVLDMLNLLKHKNTRTDLLSGGERKRLSIALELVNNPAVIFLDEPTTGLDECASMQCVSLLKVLAEGGRNVICSVHTPSAKVFAQFDHVYILSEGLCVYQGAGSDIVPFLDEVGLQCPIYYNPTDFIIDVASGEYGSYMDKMVILTNNGRKSYRTIELQSTDITQSCDTKYINSDTSDYPCSTWKQFNIILYRMYLQRTRDVVATLMSFLIYMFVAVINALLFQNVGQNAASAFSLYRCQVSTMMIHLYCSMIESLLIFPTHIQLIKREHFNRWYSLTAYFWARTVFAVPIQIFYSSAYTLVVFGPTGIPMELDRMMKFILICVLFALISETVGLCVATAMNIVNGLFFAQIVMSPLIMFLEFGWGYTEIPIFMQIVIHADYLHYALEGLLNAILENRYRIPCPETEFLQQSTTKTLTHLPDRPAINIKFRDLTYSVPVGRGSKVILKNINGHFKPGQLTAILGPSGAGKSTLLNILAGFKCTGTAGMITVNGKPRDLKQYCRMSRYIMQEDIVQPFLTVVESMLMVAELKLHLELSKENKLLAVTEILDMLNLLKHKHTRTELLSGGEKKRLSIALELVNNPSAIFLDEPTTGLDDSAGSQCVSLLKVIAQGGRNIVCSIHTPSAKIFALFDQVYILSEGQCVFRGIGSDIVPFLTSIGLHCPINYNPADFIIDVASGEYGCHLDKLVSLTKNGKKSCNLSKAIELPNSDNVKPVRQHDTTYFNNDIPEYSCSTWKQFKTLLHRMCLQRIRDTFTMVMIVMMYILIGVTMGLLFQNVGKNAALMFPQFGVLYITMTAHMFCSLFEPLLNFPSQRQLIKREHFNKWYHVRAYFWARTVFTIPNQIVYSCIITALLFGLTHMPMGVERIAKYVLVSLLISQIADTLGFCISTVMNMVDGMFLSILINTPLTCLAGYGLGFKEIPPLTFILIRLNYLRYGVEAYVDAVFEGQDKIPCPESSVYCMYTYKKDIMTFYNIEYTNYWVNVAALLAFVIFTKALGLFMLRQRLTPNKAVTSLKVLVAFIKTRILSRQ
ncbi:uncharacterized protein CBL_10448 [Carabus blaptoides fortunei]